ncbi:phosphopentomutase [Yoonia sediminilitoris]|uniref:Phosphopentomutase n=1 Tax=Yoonia sediminilitoris TaxID=1286148 RepID=A0A2T6KQ73_9RHOB|nr:phosphopentomutase [Yoonia sediminilitoris]PUB18707.1 phosphopentomutase [Yoonia sediminilitoris]RCW98875.1 phosphopentomutase [Yoonia sediminilitoris]
MPRAFVIVIDSVGIGGAPDADQYFNGTLPDTGANTVAHIAQTAGLCVPTLDAMGLGAAVQLASAETAKGLDTTPTGAWGAATEKSRGKDTPSGHWELAGVPVPWEWHTFPDTQPAFPDDLTAEICAAAGTDGILGNCHASGTVIIEELGDAHVQSGWPICYTSVDSVLQIAAHEDHFGLQRLYDLCAAIAPTLHGMKVGRVIARPFVGSSGNYTRTANRKDFAIATPAPTICNYVAQAGRKVYAVGKIGDIFSMSGISDLRKGRDAELMGHLDDLVSEADDGSFIFANLVEFDSEYGHRRDPAGYAAHLQWFDAALAELLPKLRTNDLLIVTADHGNDPTWPGTDHTRERVPVLVHGAGARPLGLLDFSDVGASVAAHLKIPYQGEGKSFL